MENVKLVENKRIKKGEEIEFNGTKFVCQVDELELPKIISIQYLLWVCTKGRLKKTEC